MSDPRTPEAAEMAIESTYTLPSPTDTPYRTPSSSRSIQTSRTYEDLSPATTPPPIPPRDRPVKRPSDENIDPALDESLPLSDPRRFTPTLHASLVSEILSLRRDAEIRTRDIDQYEQSLHNAQVQNENLNNSLLAANRETRQVRRQMQILEGGTLSAINELAKERDDAQKEVADLRSRLDQAQKKAKNFEDSVDLVQEQWQKDKEVWSADRRTLETKIHIVEGRLRVVLSEVAKAQQIHVSEEPLQSPRRSQSRTSILGSPRKRPESFVSRRQSKDSILSDHAGGRTSVLSFVNGEPVNLADELALEDIDELDCASHADEDGYASPEPALEESTRPISRISLKARKVLGLPIELGEMNQPEREPISESMGTTRKRDSLQTAPKPSYVDTGIQYSPPSSPVPDSERPVDTSMSRYRESLDTVRASKALSVVSQDSAQYSVDTSDNAWEENLRNQPIMVSSACQTIEQIPSPPQTPKAEAALSTIDEMIETREIAVQTDTPPRTRSPVSIIHKRTDTGLTMASMELQIPTIAIIPPTSRPVTPDELAVKLPPRTKNAGCQVETHILCNVNSKGIQTDDIRIDKRSMIPPPPTMPPPPVPNLPPHSSFSKPKNPTFSRRNAPNAANSSMRRSTPTQGLPPLNDDGPVSDGTREIGRPVRSSSMFAGFDENEELGDSVDDVFQDDEFFSRPATKFILSRGKLMAADSPLDDIEETEAAVAAGKRFAMEQIRLSQDNDRDFEIEGDSQIRPLPRPAIKPIKRVASSRQGNMRRTALISSGTAVHQAKSSLSSLASGDNARPPVPIPVRYSSARVGKSTSDGGRSSRASSTASPTKTTRRMSKPSLRKTRSGPALSPASSMVRRERDRSMSPPLDNRVSIVPEMPNFRMPQEQREWPVVSSGYATSFGANAGRPFIAQNGSQQQEGPEAFAAQHQTSVVDAIAQSMVGEWMFKYVRRRKSFGKLERDWDPNKSVEEMSNSASSGVRHKRWVWLAPYERSVMWSSKQPTDGTSLLGKSGRKLTIKSVLDVKDDNPMPKGAVTGQHFNRSILILTPQRALKFTATTQERHYVWLTALSFLSHSPISINDLAPLPPMPPEVLSEHNTSPSASLGGSLRRRPIRDSIRLAKGSDQRPNFRSFTTDGIGASVEYERYERPSTQEQYDPMNDAALPPVVRRYHNRNRSNTAPKPTASGFRAFLSRDSAPSQMNGLSIAIASDIALAEGTPITPGLSVPSVPSTRRGSEASVFDRPAMPNASNSEVNMRFFDTTSNSSHAASMTMRMDAFMAEQQRHATLRGPASRSALRGMRLGRPSMRNLKDPSTSSWVHNGGMGYSRDSMSSPVESMTALPTPTESRFGDSIR